MPNYILPVLPSKKQYTPTPSITFRRLLVLLVISFISLSGICYQQTLPTSPMQVYAKMAQPKISTPVFSQSQATLPHPQMRQMVIGANTFQPTPISTRAPLPAEKMPGEEWGVSKQIDEHTWTIKIGQDKKMATPQEIFSALNAYRQRHGRNMLSWDEKLAEYAQKRAQYFISKNKLDAHAGFLDFVNNQDGFHQLGFAALGENSSIGYHLEAIHLIEWVYAGDKPHDDNQLSLQWQYVGIGVDATATNLIFAGNKL
jgi:uncharacterized protein YkwD